MKNFSEETPEVHSGNGNGDKKKEPESSPIEARSKISALQEQIDALGEEIARTEITLQTILHSSAALEHGPEIQDSLNQKNELLDRLLKEQRDLLREMGN